MEPMFFNMITVASMITHVLSFRGFYGNKQAKHRKVLDMNDSSMKETMVYKDSNGAIHIAEREGPNCAWGEFKVVTGRPTHKRMRLISSYGDGNMLLKKEYDEPGKTIAKNSHRHRKQPRMHRNDTMTTEETLTVLDPPITVANPNMSFDRSYYTKSKNSYKDDRKPYYNTSHNSYSQNFNAQQIDSKRDEFSNRRDIMSNNDLMMPINNMSNIPMLSDVDNLTANPEINTMMGSDLATTATDVPMVSEMILDNGQTILAPDGLMMTSDLTNALIDDEGDTLNTTSTAGPAADDNEDDEEEDDSDEGSSNRSENGIKSILTLSGLGILALFSIL